MSKGGAGPDSKDSSGPDIEIWCRRQCREMVQGPVSKDGAGPDRRRCGPRDRKTVAPMSRDGAGPADGVAQNTYPIPLDSTGSPESKRVTFSPPHHVFTAWLFSRNPRAFHKLLRTNRDSLP